MGSADGIKPMNISKKGFNYYDMMTKWGMDMYWHLLAKNPGKSYSIREVQQLLGKRTRVLSLSFFYNALVFKLCFLL